MYILYIMVFVRKIKKKSGTYLAEVESVWENGKTKQKVIKYLGKEVDGKPVKRVKTSSIKIIAAKKHLDIEIINHIASELGITDISKEILVMVYSQLIERPSINKMEEWLSYTDMLDILKLNNISTSKLYDALYGLNNMDFSKIENKLSNIFSDIDGNNAVIIDITDTYFEGNSIEGLARRGKEEKVKKLMQIALAVTSENGFPLFHKIYNGNTSGKRIFLEMVSLLKENGYSATIMDRGFYSVRNIENINKLNIKIICGVVKAQYFRNMLLKADKNSIYKKENRVELKNTHVYCSSMEFMDGKIIIVYNPFLESLRREYYYEHSEDEDIASLLGYSLIYHNTGIPDDEVVKKYYDKDTVERTFRKMKGVISLRPVRVWLLSHVYAHIKICYLSYAILSMLEYKIKSTGISGTEALNILSTGYNVYLKDTESNIEWSENIELSKKQEVIRNLVYKNR